MKGAIHPATAAEMIPDGSSLMIGGFMAVGTPERMIDAIVARGIRDLTVIANDTAMPGKGIGKLISAGLVSRVIASHIGLNPETQTTDAVAEAVTNLTRAIGKTPRVSKDSYGFIVNRLLAPQINEAINCVYEGLATPEDIDSMMKLGANHPMGPLALGDLIGLDVVLNIMETLYHGFDDPKYRPSPLLKQMVAAGYLGRKSGKGFADYR